MACSVGGPNMETNTFSQISKQVNLMVDACYNIVKSKNITIEISQKMNKSVFSFSISIDVNKKRKKKSPSQKKREEKRRKTWIKQKEDAKKSLTTDDSKNNDKCESPPIVPGNIVELHEKGGFAFVSSSSGFITDNSSLRVVAAAFTPSNSHDNFDLRGRNL